MSPMRTTFITEMYWLTLLDLLLERHPVETLEWHGNDSHLADVVKQVAKKHHVSYQVSLASRSWRRTWPYLLCRRAWYFFRHMSVWSILKIRFVGRSLPKGNFPVGLYTRYPVLWDANRERMYGTWPDYLEQKGSDPFYAAVYSGGPLDLIKEIGTIGHRIWSKRIVLLEPLLSLRDILSCHFTLRFFLSYWLWRRKAVKHPVTYQGFSVGALWWRQLDSDVVSIEIPFDLAVSSAWRTLAQLMPSLHIVFFPFEFQPMERAVWCGVKFRSSIQTVGLQTGLYGSNQMGFGFLQQTVRQDLEDATRAPLPDFLAAYGEKAYRTFSERLGPQRVCHSGPIRYPMQEKNVNTTQFRQRNKLPENAVFLLVAGTSIREETIAILEAAFRLLDTHPTLHLLVKFHYHMLLPHQLSDASQRFRAAGRYTNVGLESLHLLITLSACMITGGSSAGVEAMAFGCMPVVYRSIGELSCNPMMDAPEAAFFWNTFDELNRAVEASLSKSAEFEKRQKHWSEVVSEQMSTGSGSADSRLYDFLQAKGCLP
jgi:hypothetical protein